MPLFDAKRSPGNSYVLYKVLAHEPGRPDGIADGETDRLRDAVVVGLPMPPFTQDTETVDPIVPLTEEQKRTVSRWIAGGMPCSL